MKTGEALIVIGAVNAHVAVDVLAKFFADFSEDSLVTEITHRAIREVCVHT